jgi:putative PIG3 family NAD(P)H quinone oxidoreductase
MRALVITPDGSLAIEERPEPTPILDQVVVAVAGAGLNRADLLQRAGKYPAPADVDPDIPGLEFSGTVHAIGPDVTALAVGDRVFGIVSGGAQAELVLTRASQLARVPEGLHLVEAAAVPEAFMTAYDALTSRAALQPGEVCCVHAVGSGVGSAAVQLAKWTGATVVGTSRTEAKLALAKEYGLDHGVLADAEFDPQSLASALIEPAGGADVILDLLGGPYLSVDVRAASRRARIVLVGMMAGPTAALPLPAVLDKRLSLYGTVLRNRSANEKAALTTEFARAVVPALDEGELRPVIDEIIALEDAATAYALLESGDTFGKLVLVP